MLRCSTHYLLNGGKNGTKGNCDRSSLHLQQTQQDSKSPDTMYLSLLLRHRNNTRKHSISEKLMLKNAIFAVTLIVQMRPKML